MEIIRDPRFTDFLVIKAAEFDAQYAVQGNCPVQAFGAVLGRELYFRARHGAWSFDVADAQGILPSDGGAGAEAFYREGDFENAGWMRPDKAVKLITKCLEEYTGVHTWVVIHRFALTT